MHVSEGGIRKPFRAGDKLTRFGITNLVSRTKTTFTRTISAALLIAGLSFSPNHSQAIDLPCPDCCSFGIMNMISDAGIMAGSFFSGILEDPNLTLDLLQCADGNPSLLSWMLHVMDENSELLSHMGFYMGETGDAASKGCQLGEQFTKMALHHNNLKNFFFEKINDDLYDNLGRNMLCKTETTRNVGQLISQNATDVMTPDSPFSIVFMNIGTP